MLPSGVPYLVMEFVDGVPIDQYCAENTLDPRSRVSLIREVCDAVQFAHQNLVIHRDIKPANILVTKEGRTKLLDFGVAQWRDAMQPGDQADPEMHRAPFTFDYASPEQITGGGCTTSSDVYSLGVTLERLLQGDNGGHRGPITRFAERWPAEENGASSGDPREHPTNGRRQVSGATSANQSGTAISDGEGIGRRAGPLAPWVSGGGATGWCMVPDCPAGATKCTTFVRYRAHGCHSPDVNRFRDAGMAACEERARCGTSSDAVHREHSDFGIAVRAPGGQPRRLDEGSAGRDVKAGHIATAGTSGS
jgi:hypothetical protein